MVPQHVMVGVIIVLLCAVTFTKERWVLEKTVKGQRLIRWFGSANAPWVLRGLLACGIVFGGLLAAGIVHPIQW